jgi:uncharacterized repeat protein (TIGR04138 family)
MLDPSHPIAKLLKQDRRFKIDAYAFVFEALNYAHTQLGMGTERPAESESETEAEGPEESEEGGRETERHLTGRQLCEAIREYALEQYGYMAKDVLNSWGVTTTGDFGEIVFNLIGIGQMRKTPEDKREDFNDVFDFDTGLRQSFKITRPES